MLATLITIIHIFVCLVLMFVVLLQQGKGGGMGSAFGGASAQVFGGSGAGNLLTRATAICAGLFMLTSVWLAYHSSAKDSALQAREAEQAQRVKDRGVKRDSAAAPATSGSGGSTSPASTDPATPAPSSTPAPSGSAP